MFYEFLFLSDGLFVKDRAVLQAYEDWRDSVSSGGREPTIRVRNPSWKMISELMGGIRSTKACYHRIYFLLSLESEERLKLISQEEVILRFVCLPSVI